MIGRALVESAVRQAIAHHYDALPDLLIDGLESSGYAGRQRVGLAIGKAALPMARALGPVARGLAVTPFDDRAGLPAGWRHLVSSHPIVDDRSLVAGDAVLELVEAVDAHDVLVALISGGASALVESPLVSLADFVRITSSLMRLGAPIAELNAVRIALSGLKGGELATRTLAPIVTLAISDVIGDDITTIGSGPTVGPWISASIHPVDHAARRVSQREAARRILERHAIDIPPELDWPIEPTAPVYRDDFARVVIPMRRFASHVRQILEAQLRGVSIIDWDRPINRAVGAVAAMLVPDWRGACRVWWGEPTLVVPPDHGEGGRMQQLALELAKRFRGLDWSALAIGSDGIDGPPPVGRPAPAGAFVDGTTWDAIRAAGIDPQAALDRCDAGTALAAVGALVITGPTGVNHADLVVVG